LPCFVSPVGISLPNANARVSFPAVPLKSPCRGQVDDVAVGSGASCAALYEKFCKTEGAPGMGRAATCLRAHVMDKAAEDFSKPCKVEVGKFFRAARKDITTFNTALAKACKSELEGVCKNSALGEEGDFEAKKKTPFACLKAKRKRLSEGCAAEVFQEQVAEAEDVRLDAGVMQACERDVGRYCDGVAPDKVLDCLSASVKKAKKAAGVLEPDCRTAVFGNLVEQSEDMRLDPGLMSTCSAEVAAFCGDEKFGDAKKKRCLFNKRLAADFGAACKVAIERETGFEAKDARLNVGLPEACGGDLKALCPALATNAAKDGPDGASLACLVGRLKDIKNRRCKAEVSRVGAVQAELWDANTRVESKCAGDVARFCSAVRDEGSAVQDCLRAKLSDLSDGCRAAEFAELAVESSSLVLKPGLVRACSGALAACVPECGDDGWSSPEGAACALKCLRAQAAAQSAATSSGTGAADVDPPMNQRCARTVRANDKVATSDFRLMPGLPEHCAGDIERLCRSEAASKGAAGEGGAGVVLACLAANAKKVRDKSCRADVAEVKVIKAEEPEADAFSAKACSQDAVLFCKDVEGPNLHECLQKHLELLDPACLHVEFEALKAGAEDVAFNPKLKAACRADIRKSCGDADAGADLLRCLEDLLTDASDSGGSSLSGRCAKEVSKLVKLKNSDYRLSPGLEADCGADMARLCGGAKAAIDGSEALGDGRVIDCLIDRRDEIKAASCGASVRRKMVQRVVDATNDPAMARDCGAEIETLCFDALPGSGNLHRCLFTDHYNYLGDACKARELKYQRMKRSDVGLNPLLKEHCAPVLKAHCKGLGEGQSAMKCLEEHMESAEANPACRSRVLQEPILRSKSLLLNPDLKRVCANDLTELAAAGKCDGKGGGPTTVTSVEALELELAGRDVGCLLANEAAVNPLCATALLNVKRARSKDLRANPGGVATCRGDIDRYCAGLPFGAGAVNRCLQAHLGVPEPEALSPGCAALQTDILLDEARDFIANPIMELVCTNERDQFCKDVADGSSRIQTCLTNQAKRDAGSISGPCMVELERVWFSVAMANKMLAYASPGFFVGVKDAMTFNWLSAAFFLWLLKQLCLVGIIACVATVAFLVAGNYRACLNQFLLKATARVAPYGGPNYHKKAGGRSA